MDGLDGGGGAEGEAELDGGHCGSFLFFIFFIAGCNFADIDEIE